MNPVNFDKKHIYYGVAIPAIVINVILVVWKFVRLYKTPISSLNKPAFFRSAEEEIEYELEKRSAKLNEHIDL